MAWIDPSAPDDRHDFRPTIPALVTDEALHGCGIVTLADDRLSEEAECMVQVGNLAPSGPRYAGSRTSKMTFKRSA